MSTANVMQGLKWPPETLPKISIKAKRVTAIPPTSGPLQLKATIRNPVPVASKRRIGMSERFYQAVSNALGTISPLFS